MQYNSHAKNSLALHAGDYAPIQRLTHIHRDRRVNGDGLYYGAVIHAIALSEISHKGYKRQPGQILCRASVLGNAVKTLGCTSHTVTCPHCLKRIKSLGLSPAAQSVVLDRTLSTNQKT